MKIDILTIKGTSSNEAYKLYTIKAGRRIHARLYERTAGGCQLVYGGMAFDFPDFEAALKRAVTVRKESLEVFGASYEVKVSQN